MEDVLNKIELIKELIMKKAKDVLKKIKSISAPELYITKPKEFKDIMEVLVEVEFILSHLPIVLDKIFSFYMNYAVEFFMTVLENSIAAIFKLWNAIIEYIPPAKYLLKLLFGTVISADDCFNVALNIALPEIWDMAEPFIMSPYKCVRDIADECEKACKKAFNEDKKDSGEKTQDDTTNTEPTAKLAYALLNR